MIASSLLPFIGIIFLYLLIPGVLLWLVFGESCRRWQSSMLAWMIVAGLRWYEGHWQVRIGGLKEGLPLLIEVLSALVSWAIASIVVWFAYRLVRWTMLRLKRTASSSVER